MKDTLLYIVSHLVEDTEKIDIKEEIVDDTTNFTISVAKEEVGKIIGKEGKIIRALRNVMKIPAMKKNIRVNISIAEPTEPTE